MDNEILRALASDGEKLHRLTGENHGPVSLMDLIFGAFALNEISPREAVEQVLYSPDYGGNREDAEALVEEWSVMIDAWQEAGEKKRELLLDGETVGEWATRIQGWPPTDGR